MHPPPRTISLESNLVRNHASLAIVLGVAAAVRLWAIDFCLPSPACRPDEEAVAAIALRFFARDPNPRFFDWPPLFMYAVALAMVVFFNILRLSGTLRSEYRFLQWASTYQWSLHLIARVLSALAGIASVFVVHRVAARLWGHATALAAAWFMALAFLHVRDSHFGVTDVPATCLVLISLLFVFRFETSGRSSDWVTAAVTAGLAAATKYNAVLITLPALWIIATMPATARRVRRAGAYVAVAAVTFLAVAPYTLLDLDAFMASMRGISTHLAGGHGPNVGLGWWVHIRSSLRYGVGTPMLVSGVAGLAWFAWRSPRLGVALALFPAASYAAVGGGLTVFARYALAIVPFICLGAAYSAAQIARIIAARLHSPRWEPALLAALVAVIVAPSAWSVWHFNRALSMADSRTIAADWIMQRFPSGATIGESQRRFDRLYFAAPAPGEPSRYRTFVLEHGSADPDVIVVSDSLLHSDASPQLDPRRRAEYTKALDIAAPAGGAVYDWQDEFYLPLTGLSRIERPGPHLEIYVRR